MTKSNSTLDRVAKNSQGTHARRVLRECAQMVADVDPEFLDHDRMEIDVSSYEEVSIICRHSREPSVMLAVRSGDGYSVVCGPNSSPVSTGELEQGG